MTKDTRLKITVCFEQRPDGGLRAYSDDVPGLVLSSLDVDGVLADVTTALQVILSARHHADVQVTAPPNVRAALEAEGVLRPKSAKSAPKEYVALVH